MQLALRPGDLVHSLDTADQDIGTQAADIAPESGHGAIGRNEQRQDIEPLGSLILGKPRILAGRPADQRESLGAPPGVTVDQRLAVRPESPVNPEQEMLPAGRAHAFRSPHMDDAIAGNAIR